MIINTDPDINMNNTFQEITAKKYRLLKSHKNHREKRAIATIRLLLPDGIHLHQFLRLVDAIKNALEVLNMDYLLNDFDIR